MFTAFKRRGPTVSVEDSNPRVLLTTAALTGLRSMWEINDVSLNSKITLMRFLAIWIFYTLDKLVN